MWMALLAMVAGLLLLVWSADRFVDGAAAVARLAGMPSLLIGMVIVGFGTSAPEMVVSAMAAMDGSPNLALGNAIGSNIVNIGLILGVTAVLAPIAVHSSVVRKELPLLLVIGLAVGYLLWDNVFSRTEAIILLVGFVALMGWTIYSGLRERNDPLAGDAEQAIEGKTMTAGRAVFWLVAGLVLLVISSRLLVWGAITIAQAMGVSDLVIGLTIVALGTSLPELASSISAARKGEHDLALGNVVGSNMFNLLAVVGIAGVIAPVTNIAREVITRDWMVMMGLTVVLLFMACGLRGPGRINRWEGFGLLIAVIAYTAWLVMSEIAA